MVFQSDSETFQRNNPSVLTDQLYLAAYCALSYSRMVELGITCIINATLELPTMAREQHDAMQIAVEDRVASKLYVYFDLVADKIHSVHKSGGKVMIYCRAGMSRSASLCIAYFMRHKGMNLEDAFQYVKKCRPIIHPNVGFMRQLREYEAKILARLSRQTLSVIANPSAAGVKRKHSTAMGRWPLVKGEPLPELVYSEEEVCDEITVPILEDIPRRPKPRICKPKPWVSDRLMESYQLVTVQVLGDSKLYSIEDHSTILGKVGLSINKTLTPKKDRRRHHSKQQHATIGIRKDNLGVAQSMYDTPLIDICPAVNDGSQPTAPPRRNPFTKIYMESTKIPVSCLTVPLGMCAEFKKGQKLGNLFSKETAISLSSLMTGSKGEGNLVAATESEELVLECCSDSMPSDIPLQTVITSSNNPADHAPCNTNNCSQIALKNNSRNDSINKCRHSLCTSNNSRHSHSQRHHPYSSNITSSRFTFTSSSSSISDAECSSMSALRGNARSVISQPRTGVATVCLLQIYECTGIYQRQNLPGNLTDTASISHFKEPPPLPSVSNVPSRFTSLSSKQSVSAFSRSAASRKSIKLSEGLKISPMPETHNKRSQLILPKSNEYLVVAIAFHQPIILEKVEQMKVSKSSALSQLTRSQANAKSKLYAPSFGVAETTESVFEMGLVYENSCQDSANNYKVAHLLTVPKRTIILSSGYLMTLHNIPGENYTSNEDGAFHIIPTKEYPYYSPHHISFSSTSAASNKLQRITIEPAVDSSWFFNSKIQPKISKIIDRQNNNKTGEESKALTPATTKAPEQGISTTSVSIKQRILKEPEVRWAAERCEIQTDFVNAKALPDLNPQCRAKINLVTKEMVSSRGENTTNEKYRGPLRFDNYSTCDYNEYQLVSLGELEKSPQRPESYYSLYIMQMCAYPLYQCATSASIDKYENTNLFCEPTPFKDRAKIITVGSKPKEKCTIDRSNFSVAVCSKMDIYDNLEELLDIPIDVIGSVAEMKKFCQNNKNVNEATMEIWFDVLKTRIIRSRPIYPSISVSELHGVATKFEQSSLICEQVTVQDQPTTSMPSSTALGGLSTKYPSLMMPSVIRARAMPLTVQRQPLNGSSNSQDLCFPIEIIECFCVDVVHATTGPLKNTNLSVRKEKCSESRTYIRDYTVSYWSEPIEELMVIDILGDLPMPISQALRTTSIKVPFATAVITAQFAYGDTEQYPTPQITGIPGLFKKVSPASVTRSCLSQLQRKPFSIVSGIRPIAEAYSNQTLDSEKITPFDQFIQNIEDQAEYSVQAETRSEWLTSVSPPVDTFWYFKLDTPQTQRRDIALDQDTSYKEIAVLERTSTPLPILAKAKSFQLFLPDPDMIDRLANSFVSDEEAKNCFETKVLPTFIETPNQTTVEENEKKDNPSDETIEVTDLVQGSVKERKPKGERRVVIADPPATVVNVESPSSIRKRLGSIGRLISYQRPRNESPQPKKRPRSRSRSKNRKKEEQKLKAAQEDRQAIYDLQSSVQNASYLLDRRRTVGRSSYYGSGTSTSYSAKDGDSVVSASNSDQNRGRMRERLITSENNTYSNITDDRQRYSTSSTSNMSSLSPDMQANGSGIRSLLGVAQSWLFSHKSRSERSGDRSKSILRRSKL